MPACVSKNASGFSRFRFESGLLTRGARIPARSRWSSTSPGRAFRRFARKPARRYGGLCLQLNRELRTPGLEADVSGFVVRCRVGVLIFLQAIACIRRTTTQRALPDSANAAALGYAEETGLPLELALIRNHYVGRTFIQPSQAGRSHKVKVKYNPVREVLEGKKVVMIDDSIVRGTTTRGLVSLVRAAGAREVHMRIASPPVTGPCYYGIDTPSREELIAANLSVDDIARHIDVDSLGYLSLDGMLAAVPGGPDGFCHACFSGDYPTPPPTDPDKLRFGCGC